MHRERLAFLTELTAALADVHTERGLARAVESTLAKWCPGVRLSLGAPSSDPQHTELWPGLAVVTPPGRQLPELLADGDVRAALASILHVARRHLLVVQRVANLSRRAHVDRKELRRDLERLAPASPIARSHAMREVLARVTLVARHPTTVLLTGESGSGKEVIAHQLHRLSPRAHRPLVQINCGALPASLIESELFGHERGAFTGADRMHRGVFERADGGTLLLDEIGDLPLPAQVKLLRVIQERKVRRVGGTETVGVDVRLVAATNRDLAAMVREGGFREDLLYRLDVFSIRLPPLRERRDDLAPLVNAILDDLAARLGIAPPRVPRTVMDRLAAHDWPGNVRELANVLEAAAIVSADGVLTLPDHFATGGARKARAFDASVRQVIEGALRAARGKIYGAGGAAERLGLKPGTLQSKMKKLGIERSRFV